MADQILQDKALTTDPAGGELYMTRGGVDYRLASEKLAELNSITHVMEVATSGAEYSSITDALASITDNSSIIRYTINVSPGVYTIDNSLGPVPLKSFTHINPVGVRMVTFVPQDPTQSMFLGANFSYITGIIFSGNTGTSYIIEQLSAGTTLISDCVMRDAANGFYVNHADGSLEINELSINNPGLTTTTYGIRAELGTVALDGINMRDTSIVTTGVYLSGAGVSASIHNFFALSPDITTALRFSDGVFVIGNSLNIGYVYDGIVIEGTATNVSIDSIKILFCQNDGLRINNTGSNIRVSLLACTVSECVGYNFSILNPNAITTGTGFTELNNCFFTVNSKFYISVIDIVEDDEGFNIFGELRVGSVQSPTETVMGEGDSYTRGMLVYTWDGVSTWLDISEAAASASGSSFGPPNGNVGTAFYIASTLNNGENYVSHYGIKVHQLTPGGSTTVHDITVTGVTSPVAVAGNYNFNSTYNNNPVYLRVTTEDMWIYKLRGTWCFSDQVPGSISKPSDALYKNNNLEGDYTGTSGNTGVPFLEINYALTQDWIFEYYNIEEDAWLPIEVSQTMSGPPYIQIPKRSDLVLGGNYQIRYDPALVSENWGPSDPIGLGTEYFWVRAVIATALTEIPSFEQFKLHSNRMEVNQDGWPEYFGTARPFANLPWDLGLLEAASSSPANQDIYISEQIGIGRVENSFANGVRDIIGFNGYLPFDLDVSGGIYLRFSYIGSDNNPGNVQWTVRWGFTNDGSGVYRSTSSAPPVGPTEQSFTQVETISAADIQHTSEIRVDVGQMVSRRIGSQNGYGDTIWITIEREGGATADTYGGIVAMLNLLPIYAKWCEGGHI